jgi:Acetoacetate decarboxylase (ADC)
VCTPRVVPVLEKEGVGEIVADSNASDTHLCVQGIGRSIQLFHCSNCGTRIYSRGRYATSSTWHIGIHHCRSSGLKRNASLWSFRPSLVLLYQQVARTTKSSHVRPSVESDPALSCLLKSCEAELPLIGRKMLKGFTAPRSPLGAAALVPSPPWHFAGDALAVEFWNDPDLSVDTLPTGVELDRKCPGHSVALFTDYQFNAQNNEYLDPARYQCRGFSVLIDAMWKGSRIAWCPYCYVDNDAALMRGWIQGYPKKFGAVHQTRAFATASAASTRLAHDSKFSACMSAHGRLLVQARVTLREKAECLVGLLDRRIVGRRLFPRLSAGLHDEPAVDELVRCVSDHLMITNIWIGGGELSFPEAYGEELELLGPLKVGRGCRFSFSYSVTDIEILGDLAV